MPSEFGLTWCSLLLVVTSHRVMAVEIALNPRKVLIVVLLVVFSVSGKDIHRAQNPPKDDKFSGVPLPAIILLSVLGVCLLLVAILYKLLSLDRCCHGEDDEKKGSKVDGAKYAELGQVDQPSDAEDEEEDLGGGYRPLTASSPSHTLNPGFPCAPGGRRLGKPGRSASMVTPRPIDPSYFLSVNNTPAAAKTSSALDVSRFRSELDLTFGSSSNNSAKYGSWAHGLAAPSSKDRAMSAYGDLTSLRRPSASDPRRRFAKLQVSISYAPTAQRLEIEVLRVEDVSDALIRSGIAAEVVVHASILPSKRSRFKTKAKPITNAAFHERWVVRNVSKKELFMQQLRFRLYSHEFLGMGRILGETVVDVMSFDLEEVANSKWLTFTPAPEIKKLLNL